MSLKEIYTRIGGDYNQILNALGSERIVQKFLLKLIDEDTYLVLADAIEKNDFEEAFRAAHTIKGICLNLSLAKTYSFVSPLTESLRYEDKINPAEVKRLYLEFKEEYDSLRQNIILYKESLA